MYRSCIEWNIFHAFSILKDKTKIKGKSSRVSPAAFSGLADPMRGTVAVQRMIEVWIELLQCRLKSVDPLLFGRCTSRE